MSFKILLLLHKHHTTVLRLLSALQSSQLQHCLGNQTSLSFMTCPHSCAPLTASSTQTTSLPPSLMRERFTSSSLSRSGHPPSHMKELLMELLLNHKKRRRALQQLLSQLGFWCIIVTLTRSPRAATLASPDTAARS
ncbi:hypothetical protein DL98DRAFT_228827 [Cadophora sp. DSE1049]|nr:hypothetical protein DL98DRAFT_228827 [Cadophora sp. DSE1049]